MESEVEAALSLLLNDGNLKSAEQVKALVSPARPTVPELAAPVVDLTTYDALLAEVAS